MCGGTCTTRCSRCKLVYYCSVDCQRTDWKEHRATCKGAKTRPGRRRSGSGREPGKEIATEIGPPLPPPSTVRNEGDAERAIRELWSIARSAVAEGDTAGGVESEKNHPATVAAATGSSSSNSTNSTATTRAQQCEGSSVGSPVDVEGKDAGRQKEEPDSAATCTVPKTIAATTQKIASMTATPGATPNNAGQRPGDPVVANKDSSSSLPEFDEERIGFVVEEMPQICRFQLTLRQKATIQARAHGHPTMGSPPPAILSETPTFAVTAEALGRSSSRTLVTVRQKDSGRRSGNLSSTPSSIVLFAGEFPRPIAASGITWTVVSSSSSSGEEKDSDSASAIVLVVRLQYPYDISACDSLVAPDGSYSSQSSSTLDEINSVSCGSCHLPLVGVPCQTMTMPTPKNNALLHGTGIGVPPAVRKVFPLPLGHWDDIADYLICYDGVSQDVPNEKANNLCGAIYCVWGWIDFFTRTIENFCRNLNHFCRWSVFESASLYIYNLIVLCVIQPCLVSFFVLLFVCTTTATGHRFCCGIGVCGTLHRAAGCRLALFPPKGRRKGGVSPCGRWIRRTH